MVAAAPIPLDESARLEALYRHNVLDTQPDDRFDLFTRLCTWLYDVPLAGINFVDADRTYFKSLIGLTAYEPQRVTSICAHTIAGTEPIMVVEDLAQDERFHDHPLVTDKGLRFYAGVTLHSNSGHALGTLCIGDLQPRAFSGEEKTRLLELAKGVGSVLELHRHSVWLLGAANQDSLTGLCNRRFFTERLQDAIAQARPGHPCTLFYLDLDGFKRVNDTFGHAAGDALLCEVAHRLTSTTRGGDVVARLGGDEFAVLLYSLTSIKGAEDVAQRILDALAMPYEFEGTAIPIRSSIGIAMRHDCTADSAELMRSADTALYQAKQLGRGQYRFDRTCENEMNAAGFDL